MSKENTNGSKKYLITLLMVLAIQTCGLFYWGGKMSARVDGLENNQNKIDSRVIYLERDKQKARAG